MGKPKQSLNMPPFCYYCDRDFSDEKILIQHQRAKHFKCPECNKRLNTATALSLHFLSVHKRELTVVPYSLQDRCKTDLEIHGLEGVPFALIEKRAKERGLELPVGYAEPEKPQVKKRKLVHSPYAQYYAQYYQYPSVSSTTHEANATPEAVTVEENAVVVVKEERIFELDEISYELPKLTEHQILTMTNPTNIYEDVKYRAYNAQKNSS